MTDIDIATGWDTSCLDWEERLLAGRSLVPELPLFEGPRDRAVRVFNRLRLHDVPGKPRLAEAGADWYRDIVAAIFGSLDPETNRRFIQEAFLLVPKGNAKTAYAASTMLTAIIVNRRPASEFNLLAPTMNIAERAYGFAAGAIKADPELSKVFHLQDHGKIITHRGDDSKLAVKAADTDVITGSLATGTLIDETHVFAAKPRAAAVFLELRGALGKRTDGFLIQITTQSKDPPAGVFKNELAIARDVRDGKLRLDPAMLAVLYELPRRLTDRDGWKSPKLWPVVNPNFNRSIDGNFLANELRKAKTPEALALLASQHFNVEVGLALAADRWPGADYWLQAEDPELDLLSLLERSEVVVFGIDGGGLDDLLGLTVIGRQPDGTWLWWSHAWAQDDVLKLRPENAPLLQDLVAAGELTLCDRPNQDVEELVAVIGEIQKTGKLAEKACGGLDPVGVSVIVDELAGIGLSVDSGDLVAISQGFKLSAAVWGAPRKLKDGSLKVSPQALMRWAVGNAKVEPRGNAVLITKQAAGKAKIDPLCAGLNAFQLMSTAPSAPKRVNLDRLILAGGGLR